MLSTNSQTPLELLYSSLWSHVDRSAEIRRLVKLDNRLRFDSEARSPIRDDVLSADLPELSLWFDGLTGHLNDTSDSSGMAVALTWVVVTGDQRIHERLLPLTWALFVNTRRWDETLPQLQWQGQSFVHNLRITSAAASLADERNRNIKGWTGLFTIEAHLTFSNSILRDQE